MNDSSAASTSPSDYSESLNPGLSLWIATVCLGALVLAALVPVGLWVALGGFLGTILIGALALLASAAKISVHDGELHAGKASIPTMALGEGEILRGRAIKLMINTHDRSKTWLCFRSEIRTAVHFEIIDPQLPHNAWLISTRNPEALLAAVGQA